MKDNYLSSIAIDKQWDTILNVINLYGHRTDIIVEMVKDGYSVTLELMELLYRSGSIDTLKKIMYYDDSIRYGNLCVKKMALLKKALGEEKAISLRDEIISHYNKKQEIQAEQKQKQLETDLKNLYEKHGFCDEFFEHIVSSEKLMHLALKTYDRDTVIRGIAKTKKGDANYFLIRNVSAEDMHKNAIYDILFPIFWLYDIETRIKIVTEMSSTKYGFEYLIKCSDENKTVEEGLISLAEVTELKEKFKDLGDRGYYFLFLAENMTEEEFEEWCKLEPENAKYYKRFNKSIFWIIKNGYYKYLW